MTTARNALRSLMARRAAYRDLTRLSERQLEDIGLNRADVDVRYG